MNTDLLGIIQTLLDYEVDFILVGGLAAVAQGAPVTTFDVVVVHRRDAENVARLLSALTELGAVIREPAKLKLPPSRAGLLGTGHNLMETRLGPLDCLGAIEQGRDYETLLPGTVELDLEAKRLRVLDLQTLVELKEQRSDDESKLRAAIPRRTLQSRD